MDSNINQVTEGTILLLGALQVIPGLAVAPIVMIFSGLFGLFSNDKKKGKD